jgi:hypothetical protein
VELVFPTLTVGVSEWWVKGVLGAVGAPEVALTCGGCAPKLAIRMSEWREGDGCHKQGVAHHVEQSVRHANSSLRDAYFSTEPHVGHVLVTSLLHVVWNCWFGIGLGIVRG